MTEQASAEMHPQHAALLSRLGGLEAAMVAQDPQIKNHLAEIHKLLITYEELVHFLTDEEIGKIMAAQQKMTNVSLVATVAAKKNSTSTAKKAASISMGDL